MDRSEGDVLVYEGVGKQYGDFRALHGVNLAVPRGEVFGLLGPNGAGKTTLIRIGLDILRPDEGRVQLFGEDLRRRNLDRVSYLPESRGLYAKTRTLDMLVYLGTLKGLSRRDARTRASEWLERLGLGFAAKRNIDGLSKGMTQKVQLIGALFLEPELCVLDEPFSGLDPGSIEDVKALIEERRSTGLTTILSTHMMNQAEALCERIAIVHGGEIVTQGEVREVRQTHGAEELRVVAREALPQVADERVKHEDDAYLVELPEALSVPEYVRAIVEKGASLEHVERCRPTLEEIFLRVTRPS